MAPTCSPSYSLIVIILTSLILFVPLATLSPPKAMLNVHIHRGASNKNRFFEANLGHKEVSLLNLNTFASLSAVIWMTLKLRYH
ncbi:hypothetical protein E4U46_002713 [Claviceps purpurea]|nr:hypothetical protein E4U46_002713 [Claviceps purpurea]